MFWHKARQFEEMHRRQTYVEPFFERTPRGIRIHKSYQAYRQSLMIRNMIDLYDSGVQRRKEDLRRFRGYAYKGMAGKV